MQNLNQYLIPEKKAIIWADEQDEELSFAPESTPPQLKSEDTWKILLVDDEVEIHQVTKLALHDFTFEGKSLTFLSAYSAEEAKQLVTEEKNLALIFLDVIMETEDAGLEVVKYIRERLQNQLVRIVLRTGQPGQIPEELIVLKYDINDYKTKTELTRQKLMSKVITSLRSYQALVSIETSKQELARIARENARLYQQIEQYAQTLEVQVAQRTRELTVQNQLLKQEIQARKQLEVQLQQANRQLQQLVTIDGLTGVANRRHFDNYLAREWRRLTREQQPLSLLLCDVDYFKLYNDTYGHLAGDDCLRQVAQTLAKMVKRPADLVARYGGEEFAVILPNTDLVGAQYLGRQILAAIRGLEIAHHRSPLNQLVTVSMGVTTQIPQREHSCSQLIQAADLALYTAKQQGRARLVVAENNLENPDELRQANRQ